MENANSLKDTNILLLPDGRRLGYAECGDPKGKPIFEFHGNPSSRLGSILFDEAARRLDIRVIGIDRPGEGHFSLLPNYVEEILNTLVSSNGSSR